MDKAEYKIATEHIKKLISQGEYAEASYIADTIDWRRVKSVMMLCTVSDLYKVNRRYQDAKELLYMAYERNPESRTILYSLCDLSIKLEEFVAAIEYYKSFVEVAPKDTGRYVLQYRLYQAQEVGLEERIEVLEQLKSEEYIEKWAYELAYLYHRIGFATKCVEECDELILWFGKGRYVYKAMELKMLHEPLTPYQQSIYDHRFEHMEQAKDMTRVLPRIDSGDSAMTDEGMVDVTDAPTVEIPQEYLEKELHISAEEQPAVAEDIQVKTLDVANAYNTMNLQKELADSLREILEVSQTESSVDEAQQEADTSVYADTAEMAGGAEEAEHLEQSVTAETAEEAGVYTEAEAEPVTEPEAVSEKTSVSIHAFERTAQKSLEEQLPVPEIISEQISIAQILPDAFKIVEPEAVMINEQITGQLSIEDVLAEWNKQQERAMEAHQEEISARIKSQTQDIFAAIEAEMKRDIFETVELSEEEDIETDRAEEDYSDAGADTVPVISEDGAEEANPQETPGDYADTFEAIPESDGEAFTGEPEPEYYDEEETPEEAEEVLDEAVVPETVPDISESDGTAADNLDTEEQEEAAAETVEPETDISDESAQEACASAASVDRNIYKAFIRSEETEVQIGAALREVSMEASKGNVRVTGHDLSVCFEFIKTLITDLKSRGFSVQGKTAKISAVNLNKKEPSEIISKVQDGVLIIERAGRLRKETVEKLQNYLKAQELSILVFITDTEQGMKHFIDKYPVMGQLFDVYVNIKDYSEDELLEYAAQYAHDCEYSIETMGLLALRTRIDEMIANEDAPTKEDARNIIDNAIDHANRRNIRHFMDVLLHKRYDAEDMIILREEDFL